MSEMTLYTSGVKHKVQGPQSAWERLKSGPLDSFKKCDGKKASILYSQLYFHTFYTTNKTLSWPFIQHQGNHVTDNN